VSLEHLFYPSLASPAQHFGVNGHQVQEFQTEITRLQLERPSPILTAFNYSLLFNSSRVNLFLFHFLSLPPVESSFNIVYRDLIAEALDKSNDALTRAATQWEAFTMEWYTGKGRPVPYWPHYIEIQEALGIYGTTQFHRLGRQLKIESQRHRLKLLENIQTWFPGWYWLLNELCYLRLLFVPEYALPSEYIEQCFRK